MKSPTVAGRETRAVWLVWAEKASLSRCLGRNLKDERLISPWKLGRRSEDEQASTAALGKNI